MLQFFFFFFTEKYPPCGRIVGAFRCTLLVMNHAETSATCKMCLMKSIVFLLGRRTVVSDLASCLLVATFFLLKDLVAKLRD